MTKPTITLHQGDIPADIDFGNVVAVDTESLGLNCTRDRLCVVQLSSGDGNAHLVQFKINEYAAPNLKKLMADTNVTKIFHFARADLAMIFFNLGVMPQPVFCTKVASVLGRTFTDKHGLKNLVHDLMGVSIPKEQQTSDWGAEILTDEQKTYAATDVLYLHELKGILEKILERERRDHLANAAFAFLPTRAALDVAGWNNVDIFAHRPARG